MKNIKVIQVGVGPIGQRIVKYIAERQGMTIIAAVDPAPDKAGKSLSQICGLDRDLKVTVAPDFASGIRKCKPDVALLTTFSSFAKVVPQAELIAKAGIPIVSTCEEMSFPWKTAPALAKKLDSVAKQHGVAILGTGVNPGFLMDYLPIALTGVCQRVDRIKVSRIQDATFRRIPFQQKIGAGLTQAQFEEKRQAGTMRHVGLTESMNMIADRMGWKLDKTEDILTPIVAETEINTPGMHIKPGMARGVQQIGKGWVKGQELITLFFRAAINEPGPRDTIEIKGEPDITSSIPGGVNGDIATCAITINAMRSVLNSTPGLKTMAGIPVAAFFMA